jgi:hypothetical protein
VIEPRPGRSRNPWLIALLALTATIAALQPIAAEPPATEPPVAAPAAPEPTRLDRVIDEQIASDQEAAASQRKIDELDDETRALLTQYRQQEAEAASLNAYSDQLSVQIQSQVDEIGFIERQLVEIESTARDVLPLMQKMLSTLDQFVELDLPFLMDERRKRVAGLEDMMARADVTISEKYRRIVEAYQIEIDYGRTLEAYQGVLGEGDAQRTVQFLRVGRVALLYQTLDGRETGYWDAAQKAWVVDDDYRHAVKEGFAVALKQGAPDLLTVPVPAPKESRS